MLEQHFGFLKANFSPIKCEYEWAETQADNSIPKSHKSLTFSKYNIETSLSISFAWFHAKTDGLILIKLT